MLSAVTHVAAGALIGAAAPLVITVVHALTYGALILCTGVGLAAAALLESLVVQ